MGRDTYLVSRNDTLYVRKKLHLSQKSTYEKLIGVKNAHLAEVFAVFAFDDFCVAVTEYVDGEPLSDVLLREGTLSSEAATGIISDVCSALGVLHKNKIVHRDLKPENVIISDKGAILTDLGIARRVKNDALRDTFVLGTAGYAAPEQFGFSQSGPAADIYAAGVLLCVMLKGHMPSEGVPNGALGAVIRRAVSIKPSDRYRNIAAFRRAAVGAPSEDDAFSLRFIRSVPGFRSLSAPKMLIAAVFYATFIPLLCVFFSWSLVDFPTAMKMLFSELIAFALPYYLIFFRKRLKFFPAFLISAAAFFGGCAEIATLFSKIL